MAFKFKKILIEERTPGWSATYELQVSPHLRVKNIRDRLQFILPLPKGTRFYYSGAELGPEDRPFEIVTEGRSLIAWHK